MKEVYFLHYDYNADERQSDGVEFCVIPEFGGSKIYFYCSEYNIFWDKIEDSGNPERCSDHEAERIRPATLCEICQADLCQYVDSVKEYTIDNGKIKKIQRIHLQPSL